MRKENPNTLLIDAGDVFQGTPYFNFYKGEVEYKAMSLIGYDVGTLGNHDFDNGVAGLVSAMKFANFDFVSTNYDFRGTPLETRVKPYVVRTHRSGDMGWVVQRHGVLYAQEYGFDEHFEALVASIVAKFIEHEDPSRERCWIAERGGVPVGCVFLVKASRKVGKLRLFLVEPDARGLGIGTRLVDDLLAFARAAGYRKVRLWTQSNLLAARHVYARAGFEKVDEEPHRSFAQDLVAETWELRL